MLLPGRREPYGSKNRINGMSAMTITPKGRENRVSNPHPSVIWGIGLLILLAALAGCNYPRPAPPAEAESPQRLTEVAGILNPENPGTPTALPLPTQGVTGITPPASPLVQAEGTLFYTTQQGDTLTILARRFEVHESEVRADMPLTPLGLLPIGMQVQVPDTVEDSLPFHTPILPDSEVIYGPTVGNFDAADFALSAGGFLARYTELVRGELMSGPEIVQRVAVETSTNPRLLLAFLEYRSGWVLGHPVGAEQDSYPIGYGAVDRGLYNELMITARLLAQGFYGWRDGSLLDVTFYRGGRGRLSPALNAGSAALMQLFAALHDQPAWEANLFGEVSFLTFYADMFGDPWSRAAVAEPYLRATDRQPELALPFAPGEAWSLTGGAHITWQTGTPRGALDFAPITGEPPCAVSTRWVSASAPGLVVRSERGVVALDMDGDGDEGTGWVLVYMHIAEQDRAPLGRWVEADEPIGHPSCEGGQASGTHVHLARKFNGEWLGAGEPIPLVLSGWRAYAGAARYEGFLQKGEQIVTSRPDGSSGSTIIRED